MKTLSKAELQTAKDWFNPRIDSTTIDSLIANADSNPVQYEGKPLDFQSLTQPSLIRMAARTLGSCVSERPVTLSYCVGCNSVFEEKQGNRIAHINEGIPGIQRQGPYHPGCARRIALKKISL